MTFRQAKKLHNGDEVIEKRTGRILRVLSVYVRKDDDKMINIETVDSENGYHVMSHKQIQ